MAKVDRFTGTSSAPPRGADNGTQDEGIDLTAEIHLPGPSVHTDLHDPRQRSLVEDSLASVPGVIGARLVPGFERQVDELHVLTVVGRSPKQTVRDAQTVLMARFGVPTDHRVISVVQLEEGHGLPALDVRPAIEEVGVVRSGTTLDASVVLRDRDTTHRGEVSGTVSASGRLRAVARATLAAVRPMLEETTTIELEGVELVAIATHEIVVVVVQVGTGRSEATLSGTSVVHDTADDATARAVLDALNRTLSDPPS